MTVDSLNEIDRSKGSSSHFRESVRLLKDLHFLIAEGKSETDEADRVRDLMDEHWYSMSLDEIRRVEGLSADLYTLADPAPPPQQVAQSDIDEFNQLSANAVKVGDWDRVLELLRERPHPHPPHKVAYIRALAWYKLGDLETSLLFLARAVTLCPGNFEYLDFFISVLLQNGRLTDALFNADKVLNVSEFVHPDVLCRIANELFGSIHTIGDEVEAKTVAEKVVCLTRKALENEVKLPEQERSEASATSARANLGICYRLLGREDLALDAYNSVLERDPDNDAALVGRGLLRFRSDQALAIEDFRKAVHGNSPYVWPYYFYAFHLITSGQFDEGLRACRAGLLRTNDPATKAEFYEWIAIAQESLDQSRNAVQASFENARSLAPWNQHIERNYQLFLQSQGTSVGQLAWSLDRGCDPEAATHRLIIQFCSQVHSRNQAA
ncbi:MAG: tetratricopeptide repeat protein [Isosphaeraceae bacterium]